VEYRRLGRTGLQTSLLGVGGGYVMVKEIEEGRRIYRRAMELGINYFDGRYGFTSKMLNPLVKAHRSRYILGSKTADTSKDGAMARIEEDLIELGSDYLDIYYLRAYNHKMLDEHFSVGGSIEALIKAKEQGKIRNIGLAGHSSMSALAKGVNTGLVDAVIFPLNAVRRDAQEELIPACQAHDTGMVIMKPVNVGIGRPEVHLRYLASQPIHVMAAGVSTVEQLEADVAALDRDSFELTAEEEEEIERMRAEQSANTCRICDAVCQPVCPVNIHIDHILYHDVFYNEYRALGLEGILKAPLAPWVKGRMQAVFERRVAVINSCTRCGKCEEVCPHHLPIMAMFDRMLEDHAPLIEAVRAAGWAEKFADAESPYGKPRR